MNKKIDRIGVNKCTVCRSDKVSVIIEIPQVPIHCNILWSTREEAMSASLGDMKLGFCENCGHFFNLLFEPYSLEYGQEYENSLHFSPRFNEYAESLVRRLIDQYDLHNKDIIEIGCGKGDFLMRVCELGGNRGVGFDESFVSGRSEPAKNGSVEFVNDFYTEKYSKYSADIICCRHVLEHIQFPRDFLNNLRKVIGNRLETAIFFEVPNVAFTLKDLGIWDLIYEHCSYFSLSSLNYLFAACGFKVKNLTAEYGNQFITIEAVPANDALDMRAECTQELREMIHDVSMFVDRYTDKIKIWNDRLEKMEKQGQKAVIWGGGSKGVTFLNKMKIVNQINYVVDLNPHKHGKYVPGTGQEIVAPDFLNEYKPDVVIIMNPIYREEIQGILNNMSVNAEIVLI